LGENGSDLGAEGDNHTWMQRAGKKVSGRLLDGRTWDEVPAQ
jgi:protein gp37